jgi:hypothetical protein
MDAQDLRGAVPFLDDPMRRAEHEQDVLALYLLERAERYPRCDRRVGPQRVDDADDSADAANQLAPELGPPVARDVEHRVGGACWPRSSPRPTRSLLRRRSAAGRMDGSGHAAASERERRRHVTLRRYGLGHVTFRAPRATRRVFTMKPAF